MSYKYINTNLSNIATIFLLTVCLPICHHACVHTCPLIVIYCLLSSSVIIYIYMHVHLSSSIVMCVCMSTCHLMLSCMHRRTCVHAHLPACCYPLSCVCICPPAHLSSVVVVIIVAVCCHHYCCGGGGSAGSAATMGDKVVGSVRGLPRLSGDSLGQGGQRRG